MAEGKIKEGLIERLEEINAITNNLKLKSKSGLLSSQEIDMRIECHTECNVTEEPAAAGTRRQSREIERTTSGTMTQNSCKAKGPSSDDSKCKGTVVITGDKENYNSTDILECEPSSVDSPTTIPDSTSPDPLNPTEHAEAEDAETVRRAREEGRVDVVFPRPVTQDGCCRFVGEILKCILYQRQQLPMTYEQLVFSQRRRQAVMENEVVGWRPGESTAAGLDWRRCQRTLLDLDELLQQLDLLFSLSLVPRVLLLLGGSPQLPNEVYEVNMERVVLAGSDRSLRASACLRQLFRTLFVADLLSDTKPVRLTTTTVMVLAHRDCGAAWFRPRLEFKVPTRVKSKIIGLSCNQSTDGGSTGGEGQSEWQDYVWFQAPLAIKGFNK
ncbi:hypothetical protein UPYG_G00329430 [Umbra pygmaea]|uniref:MAD2L1-binding protein n=1 Tax=Umbra pygmaea TaxID=75934 RepID=A0ABD0W6B1_UMBPY